MIKSAVLLFSMLGALAAGCATDVDPGSVPAASEAEQEVAAPGFNIAMQANATGLHTLWIVTPTTAYDTHLGMAPGTSPAIATASGGGYWYAFQASTGHLWIGSAAGASDTGFTMKAGTSPAITALTGGGYQVAYQANDGFLWSVGSITGNFNTLLGMASGTSPSIVASATPGQYELAFQANTNTLWTALGSGTSVLAAGSTGRAMAPGTNPSVAGPGVNYHVAYAASSGFLEVFHTGSGTVTTTALGLWPHTSPAIAPLTNTTYNVAFQAASTAHLWTLNGGDTGLVMKAATSPAYARSATGALELVFQDSATFLHTIDVNGSTNQGLGMDPASSPAAN